ncbi:MAG TPA: EF-hand domain-containing protein [Verrucomicrobiae bacterium]
MKTKSLLTLAALIGACSLTAFAQDAGGPPGQDDNGPGNHPGGAGGPGGPGGMRRPPLPLVVKALDTNNDGVIDADEIANATANLKKLDKNGDGKLSRDEYLGKPPTMNGRPPKGGQRGPGGQGGGDNQAGGPPPMDGGAGGPPPADN